MRSRPLVDKVIVIVSVAFCAVGIVRAVLGVGALPYSLYTTATQHRSASAGEAIKWRAVFKEASQTAYNSPLFMQWWGTRRRPRVAGDDYLEALGKRPLDRILGVVLGEVVRRQVDSGTKIETVVMPNDLPALIGKETAASFERADGSIAIVNLRHPEAEFEWLSGVPVIRRDYDPLLDFGQVAALRRATRPKLVTTGVSVAREGDTRSGTWILLATPSTTLVGGREFFLVPLEASGVGGLR